MSTLALEIVAAPQRQAIRLKRSLYQLRVVASTAFRVLSIVKSYVRSLMEIPVIHGLLEEVADLLCEDRLQELKEVGIFQQAPPNDLSHAAHEALCRVEGRIGLASWCLTPLYAEARRRLRRDKSDIRAANAILVVNPDYLSAWNLRKARMRSNGVAVELLFSELILSRSPKSAETWAHRAWLFRNYGCDNAQLERELKLAWHAASRAPHNYYAGAYRLRLLPHMSCQLLSEELAKGRKWLQTHVGDASGWWYHGALLHRLSELDGTSSRAVEKEWFSDMWARYGEKYRTIATFRKCSMRLEKGQVQKVGGDADVS